MINFRWFVVWMSEIKDNKMKKFFKYLAVILICLAASVSLGFAQDQVKPTISSTFPILLITKRPVELKRMTTYNQNVHEFVVDFESPAYATDQQYIIQYWLDGRRIKDFENQTLPFSFKRNLLGQLGGPHEITIKIEDNQENIVAEKTIVVQVIRKK